MNAALLLYIPATRKRAIWGNNIATVVRTGIESSTLFCGYPNTTHTAVAWLVPQQQNTVLMCWISSTNLSKWSCSAQIKIAPTVSTYLLLVHTWSYRASVCVVCGVLILHIAKNVKTQRQLASQQQHILKLYFTGAKRSSQIPIRPLLIVATWCNVAHLEHLAPDLRHDCYCQQRHGHIAPACSAEAYMREELEIEGLSTVQVPRTALRPCLRKSLSPRAGFDWMHHPPAPSVLQQHWTCDVVDSQLRRIDRCGVQSLFGHDWVGPLSLLWFDKADLCWQPCHDQPEHCWVQPTSSSEYAWVSHTWCCWHVQVSQPKWRDQC